MFSRGFLFADMSEFFDKPVFRGHIEHSVPLFDGKVYEVYRGGHNPTYRVNHKQYREIVRHKHRRVKPDYPCQEYADKRDYKRRQRL